MIRPAQPPPSLVLPGPQQPAQIHTAPRPRRAAQPPPAVPRRTQRRPQRRRPRREADVAFVVVLVVVFVGARPARVAAAAQAQLGLRVRVLVHAAQLPGLGDLIVEVGVHVHAQVVAGPAALAGGEEVLLVEHLVRHAIFPTVKPKTFLGVRNLIVQIPHLARLLAFGNVLESVLPRGLGLGELLRELLPPHRLGVLLLLPPLLADLVQALGHPGGLQPRAAEVLDVQAAAVHLLLVGAEARERRSFYEQLARAAGGRVVLLLLLGGAAMVVVALVVGAEEGGLGYGVAGGGVPDRVRLFVTELEGRHSNGDGGAREELTSRGVRSGRRPNMAACPCQIGSAIERGGSGGVYTWTEVSPIELATVRSC
ncbi:hypothetical protein ColTof3_04728 [Colletotrichum tofieldiae]|nr:hypothetical protein ColTof3_04728 [Colletotrichum tofieldiae]GKT86665.1 hypothetical protein Ct61P_04515 [Colletotrichum tofieldiae]